jgi:hypothetical protein
MPDKIEVPQRVLDCVYESEPEDWHQHSNGGGWVYKTATVESSAYLHPTSIVSGNALVSGNARVSGNALVSGSAQVSGNACAVCDHEGDDVHASAAGAYMVQVDLCSFCDSTSAGNTAIHVQGYSNDDKFAARLIAELYWKLKEEFGGR